MSSYKKKGFTFDSSTSLKYIKMSALKVIL